MANTDSAKKAVRSSAKKRKHNLYWKIRIKKATKNLENLIKEGGKIDILNEGLSSLQKVADKAAKERVIHKNKANRIKASFAKKISAHDKNKKKQNKKEKTKETKNNKPESTKNKKKNS